RMLVDMRAECYMGVPLRDSAGRVLGLMALLDTKPLENEEMADAIFKLFAVRAAAELERMQVQEKMERDYHGQRVIRSVLEISQRPLPLEEQLEETLDVVFSVPSLNVQSKGCVFLAENGSGVLAMAAHRGLAEPLLSTCARVPFGRCHCGKAAEERRVVFASRVDSGHEVTFDGMDPHGHICVPILSADRVLGVLNLYVDEGHGRTAEEDALLGTVVGTLAGVIERRQAKAALRETPTTGSWSRCRRARWPTPIGASPKSRATALRSFSG
ncbi:MAG: GAF domain-containing protein, partial [Nitrospirae bacterium]|nr:GAF domain-containing protein [Nitrospirota bacterium]